MVGSLFHPNDEEYHWDEEAAEAVDRRQRLAERSGVICPGCKGFPCSCSRCDDCGKKGFECSCPPIMTAGEWMQYENEQRD